MGRKNSEEVSMEMGRLGKRRIDGNSIHEMDDGRGGKRKNEKEEE